MIPDKLIITRPDDWHLHLRDGLMLATVLADTAYRFRRAIVMPNLNPPITTLEAAKAYRERILAVLPNETSFEPLMTLYLNDEITPGEVEKAYRSGIVHGVKLYPAGATTNSDFGVTSIKKIEPVLALMQILGLPLLLHGEVTDPGIDVFDREKVFLQTVLAEILDHFPRLKIVLEHITTLDSVEFVKAAPSNVAATITAHHLILNRNAMFAGGFRPHHYCLPILKRENHRMALVGAATSGNPKFFLGTDSAPHTRTAKEKDCGCAGLYTAHAAIELYAEVFDSVGALDRLEGFASFFGADFYGLPRNSGSLTLIRHTRPVPAVLPVGQDVIVPFRAGTTLQWQVLS